jgi:hypothetical protein
MILNVKYPFLFTSTVLYGGVYNILDRNCISFKKNQYFFQIDDKLEENVVKKFWKQYNPVSYGFKRSLIRTKKD